MTNLENIYGALPDHWDLVTIGQLVDRKLADLQTGPFGTHLQASEYRTEGTPVIAVKNIGENQILLDDDIPRIDQETVSRLARYQLLANDIIFGRKGAVNRRALITKMSKAGCKEAIASGCVFLVQISTPDIFRMC